MKSVLSRLFGILGYKRFGVLIIILLVVFAGIITGTGANRGAPSKENKVKGVQADATATSSPQASTSPSPKGTTEPSSSNDSDSNSSPAPTQSPTPQATQAGGQATATPTPTPSPTPSPTESPSGALSIKVLNVFFVPYGVNPIYNPNSLSASLVDGMKTSSHNKLQYTIVETQEAMRSTTKNSSGRMDYNAFLSEFGICNKLTSGAIDEVWIWVNGSDGAGFEYAASGPTVSDSYSGMNSCGKNMFVMGFDYTRTWDLALHSMGHRMEFAAKNKHFNEYVAWDSRSYRYSSPYNTEVPLEDGVVGCGNVHFPPNGTKHYDYTNNTQVQSVCTGAVQTITCSIWGCSQEGSLKWWFSYAPEHWWDAFVGR